MRKSYKRFHTVAAGFLRLIYRIHVTGLENEPETGSLLLCSNHLSMVDPICICAALRKTEPYYMAKKSLFKIPIVHLLIKAFNAYPVNRGASDLGAIHKTINLLKDGNCVGIFPQGTRCRGKNVEDTVFKTGAALIAIKADVPILPIRICMKGNRWRLFRRIDIIVGKVITPEEIGFEHKKAGELDRVTSIISERICTLSTKDGKK